MFRNKGMLLGITLLFASAAWAQTNTYYGGFEDSINGDYDYNDLVFSLSGDSLALLSPTGHWNTKPALAGPSAPIGLGGTPFWNNGSSDGSLMNVGYCIYGGGNCGAGLSPNALYLAASNTPTGSANDVTFSVNGEVTESVVINITADTNALGWEATTGPNAGIEHFFSAGDQTNTFTPGGDFVLLAQVNGQTIFSSDPAGYGASDPNGVSHFAFFTPVPEPASIGMLALAVIGVAYAKKRKIA